LAVNLVSTSASYNFAGAEAVVDIDTDAHTENAATFILLLMPYVRLSRL